MDGQFESSNQPKVESVIPTSGAKVENVVSAPPEPTEPDNPHVKKILNEKNNWKTSAFQFKEENEILKQKLKAIEENELVAQQKYQELSEMHKKDAEEWKGKYVSAEKQQVNTAKKAHAKSYLNQQGYNDKQINVMMDLVNTRLDEIKYDNESNTIYGVEDVLKPISEAFKDTVARTVPGVNQAMPQSVPGVLTLESWKMLPPDEKKKRYGELKANLGIPQKH